MAGKTFNWIYISSKSEEELKIVKNRLAYKDKNFAVIEDWMIPILTRGDKIKWKLSTIKLVLSNEISIAEPKYSMSELTTDDNDSIYENSEDTKWNNFMYTL